MSENKELKPRSFRVDDETAEKFKQITAEIGGNQQAALYKLIETYEFQKGKAVLINKKDDIEKFEKYISIATRMYMDSLEETENATETVRIEFDALLKSKDETIISLQTDLTEVKQASNKQQDYINQLEIDCKNMAENNARISKDLADRQDNYESIINDKDALNKALTESYNSLKAEVLEKDNELKGLRGKAAEYDKAIEDKDRAIHNLGAIDKRMKKMEQDHKAELHTYKEKAVVELEKALVEKDKECNLSFKALEKEKNEEVAMYQAKYLELLQTIQEKATKPRTRKTKQTTEQATDQKTV